MIEIYNQEYPHYQYCVQRAGRPIRRIYDIVRHAAPILDIVKRGDNVLDLGSGIGEAGHDLRWLGCKTTSFDISLYAQKAGTNVFGREKFNRRIVGNVLYLPFENGAFDTAVSWDLYEHLYLDQMADVLKETERVIGKNRMFIKLTPTEDLGNIDVDPTHVTKWSSGRWRGWFEDNGWTTLKNPTRMIFGRTTYGNFLLQRK